jgi:Icc protein
MAKYSWATDVHLDFVSDQQVVAFASSLIESEPEGVIITGDISTAETLVRHLSIIESVVKRPIYFVLGNHDYYGGSIEGVRSTMKELSNISQYLRYLPLTQHVSISPGTCLIGHDGWYDAGNGDWKKSDFQMTDWTHIKEFAQVSAGGRNVQQVVSVAKKLAHEGTLHIHNSIKAATRYYKKIVIATHVPPFPETHLYKGKMGDDKAQPWFTSKMLGDMLLDASKAFPDTSFTVLAGHTHGEFSGQITNNLFVHVGAAEYRQPKLQKIVEL